MFYHPSHKERIAYLEKIADEQNEPPVAKVDWETFIQKELQKGTIQFDKQKLTIHFNIKGSP